MLSFATARRWLSLPALALALTSCADGGFVTPEREFTGVWLYEFEGSSFVEGATEIPAKRPPYEKTDWLEWTDQPRIEALLEERLSGEDCYTVQPIRLTFIGHRTHRPFGAGHMGLWRSTMTVERTISAERLGPSFCYEQ